jgi:hypothetical protein
VLTLLVSCKPASKPNSFSPTQNGFGVAVQAAGVDSGPGAKLYYRGTNETPTLLWPCIGTHGYPLLYTNDIVLLLADKPDEQGRMGSGALIVAQGTGPAMDISAEVLAIAAEQAQVDFPKALEACQVLRLKENAGEMEVYYLSDRLKYTNMPDLETRITWDQIFSIMQDVRQTGKTNKLVNTEVSYLQKDYGGQTRRH